jgi:hypothetical protein
MLVNDVVLWSCVAATGSAPGSNPVLGQASLATGVGVFSLARMDPAFPDVTRPSAWSDATASA